MEMDMYQQTQELVDNVCSDIQACVDLVGKLDPAKETVYGFIPGMSGMENQAETMRRYIQTLRQGIFQVLFTGGFGTGKSTLLNALMRKEVLRTSIYPETAVITKIVFHADEKVIVHKKQVDRQGNPITEIHTIETFFKKYRVDQDDPEKFKDIDYVQLQQEQDGIGGSLVQLVDSPGTSHSETDTEMVRSFAQKASAEVFVINARMPFTYEDKLYIKSHYANTGKRNLFFVVNRFDLLPSDDQKDLKELVCKQLQEVFTVNGQFDEELFASRFFYTNAFVSMNTRLGMATPTRVGNIMIDDNTTGVPQLETALGRFLTGSNRDKDALAAYVPKLATIFAITKDRIAEKISKYTEYLESIQCKQLKLSSDIEQIEIILDRITAACKIAVENLRVRILREYDNYVNDIAAGWDNHFSNPAVLRGIKATDLTGITVSRDQERFRPIKEAIKDYASSELPLLEKSINQLITAELTSLSETIEIYRERLNKFDYPINMGEIVTSVFKATPFDASRLSDACFWACFSGIVICNSLMSLPIHYAQLRAQSVLPGIWWNAGGKGIANLISGIKTSFINDLRKGRSAVAAAVEEGGGADIIRASNSLAEEFRAELDAARQSVTDMAGSLKSASFDLETEIKRTASLLSEMEKRISHINEITTGKPLPAQEILGKAEGVVHTASSGYT